MTFELRIEPDGTVAVEIGAVEEMPEGALLAVMGKAGLMAIEQREEVREVRRFTAATTPEEQDYTPPIPDRAVRDILRKDRGPGV